MGIGMLGRQHESRCVVEKIERRTIRTTRTIRTFSYLAGTAASRAWCSRAACRAGR
jgi:hypothetical protein